MKRSRIAALGLTAPFWQATLVWLNPKNRAGLAGEQSDGVGVSSSRKKGASCCHALNQVKKALELIQRGRITTVDALVTDIVSDAAEKNPRGMWRAFAVGTGEPSGSGKAVRRLLLAV